MPRARLELARCCHRGILSPLRLPIPPSGPTAKSSVLTIGVQLTHQKQQPSSSVVIGHARPRNAPVSKEEIRSGQCCCGRREGPRGPAAPRSSWKRFSWRPAESRPHRSAPQPFFSVCHWKSGPLASLVGRDEETCCASCRPPSWRHVPCEHRSIAACLRRHGIVIGSTIPCAKCGLPSPVSNTKQSSM
jgi:hypothetical protein